MPYSTQWMIDNRIIKTRMEQKLTPDSKEAKDARINHLLNQSNIQNTHIILDCIDIKFPTFKNWQWIRNARLGWVVIYGVHNPVTKFAMSIGLQTLGVRHQFVDSADSALTFLQEVDITLPKAHAV